MRKILFLTIISGLAGHSLGHAGNMGPMSVQMPSQVFASAEGSYTWNQIGSYSLNSAQVNPSPQHWGGRVAAGMLHPITDKLRFSAELGGGYYGSSKLNLYVAETFVTAKIDGYDALVGLMYKLSNFDVFGNVGVMAQNLRVQIIGNTALQNPGGLLQGTTISKFDNTQILPEIKVGGIFNLNDSWGLSLAYMHVFGSVLKNSETTSNSSTPPVRITQNLESNVENPSLDSIMLGIRYSI